MRIGWTRKAASGLARLQEPLRPVAPDAAARVVQQPARAPDRLLDHPRIGEKLDAYAPREVRRSIVGHCELRCELADATLVIPRLWHSRESGGVEEPRPPQNRSSSVPQPSTLSMIPRVRSACQ